MDAPRFNCLTRRLSRRTAAGASSQGGVPMSRRRGSRPGTLRAVVVLLLAVLPGAVAAAATAQDSATPVTGEPAPVVVPRPAHIHTGSCGDLGDVVYPLNDVPTVAVRTIPSLTAVGESTTTVEVSLDDLLASPYAVNVHASAQAMEDYIACGDLAGTVTAGRLSIPLGELNGSGFTGEAVLVDGGDGTTTVTVVLLGTDGTGSAPAGATPVAAELQIGTIVTTTSENVRLRAEPSTEAEILATLPTDTQLEVTGTPEQGGEYLWYPVTAQNDEATSGWVAGDFIAPAEGGG